VLSLKQPNNQTVDVGLAQEFCSEKSPSSSPKEEIPLNTVDSGKKVLIQRSKEEKIPKLKIEQKSP
jgi:hypothetical protein